MLHFVHFTLYAWRRVVDITMTHGIQPKISVCLSVIRKRSRSRAARRGRGLLIDYAIYAQYLDLLIFYDLHFCKDVEPILLKSAYELY